MNAQEYKTILLPRSEFDFKTTGEAFVQFHDFLENHQDFLGRRIDDIAFEIRNKTIALTVGFNY